ncbi:sporulation protein YqfD [Bacillus sp. HMF5848]|uniref:sporulation protein YqfD n=1 Tax=Bacillus sp. HMF5848 TaxID=2495421 RepID=UPI000F7B139A|nr:sporulation protein YqfD [Bacillus sp. HMF5848]RSK27890.1 sporulation protein YqfD [Bacillus sp. HMF5848]
MKNHWTNFFGGHVQVSVQGKGVERFINACVRDGIDIWHVKKVGSESALFNIKLDDVSRLRVVVRQSDYKVSFKKRIGFPFLAIRARSNSGFIVGALFFCFVLFILSNMVWGIEITGAKPEMEHSIQKKLNEIGVQKGALQFFLDSPEGIQRRLTNEIDGITWIGVKLKGTTYHFKVVEKNIPTPADYVSPRNLIASKKAVIVDMFVEEGQPLVAVNDFVKKGDTLVSGILGKEEDTKIVPARGVVWGETWYQSTVEVPMQTEFSVMTGNSVTSHYLKVAGVKIPFWGFNKPTFSAIEENTVTHSLHFLRWKLPIEYERLIKHEKEDIIREYTFSEAVNAGKQIAHKELSDKLSDDATIKGEKVLHQSQRNGKVKLIIHFQVIENIAKPQPIIQGD